MTLRIETVRVQVLAIDQVIAIYDPAHAPKAPSAARPRQPRDTEPLPPELDRINKSEGILEVLREAGRPLSAADCTCMIADRHGVAANDASLSLFVTHISPAVNSLMKRSRVH